MKLSPLVSSSVIPVLWKSEKGLALILFSQCSNSISVDVEISASAVSFNGLKTWTRKLSVYVCVFL